LLLRLWQWVVGYQLSRARVYNSLYVGYSSHSMRAFDCSFSYFFFKLDGAEAPLPSWLIEVYRLNVFWVLNKLEGWVLILTLLIKLK